MTNKQMSKTSGQLLPCERICFSHQDSTLSFTQLWTHFKLDNVFQNGVIIDIRLVLSAIDLVCDLQAEEKAHFCAF